MKEPTYAGDVGSVPVLGGSHVPRGGEPVCARTTEHVLRAPAATATEKPVQRRRPSTAINK